MSNLQQQRLVVEQLRREASMRRVYVSQAVKELKEYILQHEQDDCLLTGFHNQKANPFREKSTCLIL